MASMSKSRRRKRDGMRAREPKSRRRLRDGIDGVN